MRADADSCARMAWMLRRAIFLDVDGTLVTETGRIPSSARRAVREARQAGHLVFLCTGRTPVEFWPGLVDIGFDGLIAAAGGYVRAGDDVLRCTTLSQEHLSRVRDFFRPLGCIYYVQGVEREHGTPGTRAKLRAMIREAHPDEETRAQLEAGPFDFIDRIQEVPITLDALPTKANYVHAPVSLEEVRDAFTDIFDVLPSSLPMFGPTSGELMLRGVHKASGIQVLLDHLGIDRTQTVAIGDGCNDIEMLEFVADGIAMGQAPEAVRAVASDVTGTPDEDGIWHAFRAHHLVGA